MNRNAPCPCGSGRRFKHCCGTEGTAALPTRALALEAHRAGSLRLAEGLYRRALEENRADVDVLHMLGVVLLERLQYHAALDLLLQAAEQTQWAVPQVRHNLGLVLGKLLVRETGGRQASIVEEFLAWEQAQGKAKTDERPLVSVILPAFNHARFVAQALASVAAQTYPDIELVVIDDGSTDGTAEVIAACVAGMSIPVRFIVRTNRGAPATLNEGAALARGKYLAFLNSDDYFAPDRIAALVDGIARAGLAWGFSLVAQVDEDQEPPEDGNASPAGTFWQLQRSLLSSDSNSFSLLAGNVAVSTGNLFVEREFFGSLGGFRDFRFNHDWDFCLRAAALAEPMIVRRPLYFYRLHADNTINESRERATAESDRILGDFIVAVLSGAAPCANPLAPQWPGNRALLLLRILGAGMGKLLPIAAMRELAAQMRAAAPLAPAPRPVPAVAAPARRTAVVVLGMHRSGTSALARVLNLCGTHLPADLRAPDLEQNPTGFWESEAIINLNERILRQLGAAWNRTDFAPPGAAAVEEFVHDAVVVLASEYGQQPTILIKDPRICLLAPLWHQALTRAGYRTVFVVPVREPVEVAQSLHARGDMTVPEGLALWLAYMQRVGEFAHTVPGVVYLRFTDLLDDWRGVVGRIAKRLDLALDIDGRARDVDRFLEPGLRRQRVEADALDTLREEAAGAQVRAFYRDCLDRCDRDAGPPVGTVPLVPSRQPAAAVAAPAPRTSVVVLGMHRSGTSALSRSLNLCGAFLPANLRPPKLRNNPKGSWEPEEVVNLNQRILRHLGGAWNVVGLAPPGADFVEEFVNDAQAVLASEYGQQPTIVIKDPSICLLAPLWHEALTRAGYRTVYVVPVRDPLEVARSLEARGDMTVSEGLALWLAYMQQVAEFTGTVPGVMYVRYTDLLDDWRGVLLSIAKRLDLALDVDARAGEVDRFLEPGLRRQRATEGELDALPEDSVGAQIRSLYRNCLARCDADATIRQDQAAVLPRHAEISAVRPKPSRPTASFVLCIENNAIRDQALLLCESIRRFGGIYRDAPITAFSPRAGLAVDRDTRRALADLRVEYVDEPLNTTCTDYGPANRVFAGAWAEAQSTSDFTVVLDSDAIFLAEPELPIDADVAVRPVDSKGSATRGPGDAFEDYWMALAAMDGTTIDRLPYIRSTIEGERIRASYNGGLIVTRRDKGILTRSAELFSRSLHAGMRPYRGSGIDIFASTGPVGLAGSEFWGASQAVLAIAIWATTDRVVHLPACYNIPLHLVAAKGELAADWLARPPVHVHYHYMFAPNRYEVAMEILAKLGVTAERLAWLAERIPLGDESPARRFA